MARQNKWSVQKRLSTLKLRRKFMSLLRVTRMLIAKIPLNFKHNLLYCVMLFATHAISSTLVPKMLESELQKLAD